MYLHGHAIERNYDEAFKWFIKSAEQGNSMAENNIGEMYLNGEGLEKNYNEAFKWFKKSAEHGDALG